MVYQLFATLKNSLAIAIALLLTSKVQCLASEYIFTAPPEVDHQLLEAPSRETEYPLYECAAETEAEEETALDAHNCHCIDCEDLTQDTEADEPLTRDSPSQKGTFGSASVTSKKKPNKQ